MATHKLDLGEFDEIDYHLIAIHTPLEDYRLAYAINKILPLQLSKTENEIQINIKEGEINFARFYYHDIESGFSWNLIQNKNQLIEYIEEKNYNLFCKATIQVVIKAFLLPELKKVDYFLKIENNHESIDIAGILLALNTIHTLSTAYLIVPDKIKSKNNLIF